MTPVPEIVCGVLLMDIPASIGESSGVPVDWGKQISMGRSRKVMVNLLARLNMHPAARTNDSPDTHNQPEAGFQFAAEYWARRTMWLLVTVTSLWDIVVTFDKHFDLTGRLLTGRLL
jgi:hypothetical protein